MRKQKVTPFITTRGLRRLTFTLGAVAVLKQFTGVSLSSFLLSKDVRDDVEYRTLGGDKCDGDAPAVADRWKRKRASNRRSLSINLGGGDCEWTPAQPLPEDTDAFGIVIASYPAAGMRLTWQHVEGLTGIQIGDDFDCEPVEKPRIGIVKTQYPHLEGLWSWGDNMDQTVLLVRNPRWAIPSYHTLLHEIDYAHDCETAYEMLHALFTYRPPLWKWIRWRDLRFEEEIKLWCWHIDYWMGNGTQYWMDWDFERNGQWPFKWIPEAERTQDVNCIYQGIDCVPQTVVAYEYIRDPVKGPEEINKIAKIIEGKHGLMVIEEEARTCVWHQTMTQKTLPDNDDRAGDRVNYGFTYFQMGRMRDEIARMKTKYSSGQWVNDKNAEDLCKYFTMYIDDIESEMEEMLGDMPPSPSPNPDYHQGLVDWYKDIGRGDRYNKERVQTMFGLWPKIKHLYGE